jgi:hypothetical protein
MGEFTSSPADDADGIAAHRVKELVGTGYISAERAQAIVAAAPEARDRIVEWLRSAAASGDWRTVEKFANLAAHTRPEGLAAVLAPIVADGTAPTNYEDLVEILGEVADHERDPEAVPAIVRLLTARMPTDGPAYALSLKALQALGTIGGAEAEQALRAIAEDDDHPSQVRWEAAVELGIEDDLGFDEDEMTGPPVRWHEGDTGEAGPGGQAEADGDRSDPT